MNRWTFLSIPAGRSIRATPTTLGFGNVLRSASRIACTAVIAFSIPPAGAADGENLKLVLIDASSNQAIPKQPLTLWGDAEVRCIRAPCPMVIGILWRGTSSSRGVVIVPRKALKRQAAIEVSGYVRQAISTSVPDVELRILMTRVRPQP